MSWQRRVLRLPCNSLKRKSLSGSKYTEYYGICQFSSVNESKIVSIVQKRGKNEQIEYSFKIDNEDHRLLPADQGKQSGLFHIYRYLSIVPATLLPKGYPDSVGSGYLKYVKYQMLSACLSSAGGILSMQALLMAVGVGAGSSLPLAATINWVLKDGLGQFGGIFFASFINIQFDTNPKKWRFISALSLEISNVIEMITPLFAHLFLPLASIANIGKNISYLAASASRAAIHKSFATEDNLADITARSGSQNILSSMIGTSLGITISSLFMNQPGDIFLAFGLLSSSSLLFNYLALRNVSVNTLNYTKLEFLIHSYFRIYGSPLPGHLFLPSELRPLESVLTGKIRLPFIDRELFQNLPSVFYHLKLDQSFRTNIELQNTLKLFQSRNCHYLVNIYTSEEKKKAKIFCFFMENITKEEIITASIHLYLLRRKLENLHYSSCPSNEITLEDNIYFNWIQRLDLLEESFSDLNHIPRKEFLHELFEQKDWHISKRFIDPSNSSRISIQMNY